MLIISTKCLAKKITESIIPIALTINIYKTKILYFNINKIETYQFMLIINQLSIS